MPQWLASWMIVAAVVSAAKPCTGGSRTILWPSGLMMRQPPAHVPAAMVSAHTTFTQGAIFSDLPMPG
jgi:hypothetical protein